MLGIYYRTRCVYLPYSIKVGSKLQFKLGISLTDSCCYREELTTFILEKAGII